MNRSEFVLRVLTLAMAAFAAIWGYFTYTDTKEKEFYTYYWNKKLSLFLETSAAASVMATTTSREEFEKARAKYWELYYGRLSLVEGVQVKNAMKSFAKEISRAAPFAAAWRRLSKLQQPLTRFGWVVCCVQHSSFSRTRESIGWRPHANGVVSLPIPLSS